MICGGIAFSFLLQHLSFLRKTLSSAIGGLSPIIVGFGLAYLLNPILKILEYKCLYPFLKKRCKWVKDAKKTAHTLGVIFSMLLFLLLLFLFFYMVIPQLYISIVQLVGEIEGYYQELARIVDGLLADYPELIPVINQMLGTAADSLQDFVNESILPIISGYMSQIASGVINVVVGIKDFLLGLIIAIYVMLYQKRLLYACKRLTAIFFKPKVANRIYTLTRKADYIFSGFISGKILDSIIIGILCFILMSIFKMPYSVLISVIVCVTNVIPFFGPFFGAIPSIMLLLLVDPLQAVYFTILILLLQQFDGNVLGPMILGDSTGLNPFWVVIVILAGGSWFGFAGMVLGLPTFAFFYSIFKEYITKRAKERNMPTDEQTYEALREFTADGEMVLKSRYPTDEELAEHSFRKNTVRYFKDKYQKVQNFLSKFQKK